MSGWRHRWLLVCLASAVMLPAVAHEGEVHAESSSAQQSSGSGVVRWIDDQELQVPKSVQHLLGIRTAPPPLDAVELRVLPGEVVAAPSSPGALRAPQAGRLEAAGIWPLPGRQLRSGELIAWLRPVITQRDEAQRRAQLADVEQKLQIARINAERLRVQSEAMPGQVTNENVYREQAELELEAMQKRRELENSALRDRMPIRAALDGVLYEVAVREGEVVAPGQPLFAIAEPGGSWLAVNSDQPAQAARVRAAVLRLGDTRWPLQLRGELPAENGRPGWRLLFEPETAPPRILLPGEMLSIELSLQAQRGEDSGAAFCVPSGDGVLLWVHTAPERFRMRRYRSCADALAQAAPDERWVTQAAALLAQYH